MILKKWIQQIIMLAVVLLVSSVYASAQTRINFRRGSTSASVSGKLVIGDGKTFVLSAKRGQILTATLSSGSGDVRFQDGEGGTETSESFQTVAGNNYIYITNIGRRTTNFTLTISIR